MKTFDKIAYTLGALFYCSLICGTAAFFIVLGANAMSDPMKDINEAAESILETPDLATGLEALDMAVEQDLKDLEAQYNS